MYGFAPYQSNANSNYFSNYNQPAMQDERIWVQNETSADAYLVAPNGFVRLWDAQRPVFYEKRADATGRPLPLEVYEYAKKAPNIPIQATEKNECTIDYRKEIDALNRRIDALEKGAKNEQSNADDTAV